MPNGQSIRKALIFSDLDDIARFAFTLLFGVISQFLVKSTIGEPIAP
jgi:hypothetical protein